VTWYLTIAHVVGGINKDNVRDIYGELVESARQGRSPNDLIVSDVLYRSKEESSDGDTVNSFKDANERYGLPVSFEITESVLLPFYIKRTTVRVRRTKTSTIERLIGFDYIGFSYVSISPAMLEDREE
jgi:hypothetical protein